jgi:hypothetical protein
MTFEVHPPRLGELRAADVRRELGASARAGERVDVVVLGLPGKPPFAGIVALVDKRAGRGRHVVLLCPACSRGREVLVDGGRGQLVCRPCARQRTRRQRERALRAFRLEGGREEDALMRLVGRPGSPTSARLDLAGDLTRQIALISRLQLQRLGAEADGILDVIDREVRTRR